MKPQELRIGNLVKTPKGIQKVFDVMCDCINSENYECLTYDLVDSIPLTPDWLEKFGFKDNYLYITKDQDTYIEVTFDGNNGNLEPAEICMFKNKKGMDGEFYIDQALYVKLKKIQHVHQLQNLYFALTGKELTLNDFKDEQDI